MWLIDTFHNFRKIRHAAFYAKKYHLAPWRELVIDKFNPSDYKDEYRCKVQEAIERKIAGKEIVSPKESGSGKMIDLMEALTKSLELAQKPKTVKRTATKTTAERKKA